jgi:hypothetical protein
MTNPGEEREGSKIDEIRFHEKTPTALEPISMGEPAKRCEAGILDRVIQIRR